MNAEQVAALRKANLAAAQKAAQPSPTANPTTATPVQPRPSSGAYPVPTGVPNQSPSSRVAGWPAQGPVQYMDDGVGLPGLEIGGYNLLGHSDALAAANNRVLDSMAMDPTGQAVTGGGHARGTDYNSNPVSPLFDRGAPVNLRDVGRR